ncbi:unannotated protein [freshwater metagenome]|uniref:Unannotated protein n=1 Tax=freshwater metagenome TaxID=449393 RepID=A0A6J6UBF1_9ZZZZ
MSSAPRSPGYTLTTISNAAQSAGARPAAFAANGSSDTDSVRSSSARSERIADGRSPRVSRRTASRAPGIPERIEIASARGRHPTKASNSESATRSSVFSFASARICSAPGACCASHQSSASLALGCTCTESGCAAARSLTSSGTPVASSSEAACKTAGERFATPFASHWTESALCGRAAASADKTGDGPDGWAPNHNSACGRPVAPPHQGARPSMMPHS